MYSRPGEVEAFMGETDRSMKGIEASELPGSDIYGIMYVIRGYYFQHTIMVLLKYFFRQVIMLFGVLVLFYFGS